MIDIQQRKDGVSISIHVLPRSSRCALAGIQEGAIRLKLTAAPVDGRANEECLEYLAELLGIKKGQMDIISGHASRKKIIQVSGMTREAIEERLSTLLKAVIADKVTRKDRLSGRKA